MSRDFKEKESDSLLILFFTDYRQTKTCLIGRILDVTFSTDMITVQHRLTLCPSAIFSPFSHRTTTHAYLFFGLEAGVRPLTYSAMTAHVQRSHQN